jgi:hypothetical protein
MVKYAVLNKTPWLKCVYVCGNAQLTNRITLNTHAHTLDRLAKNSHLPAETRFTECSKCSELEITLAEGSG